MLSISNRHCDAILKIAEVLILLVFTLTTIGLFLIPTGFFATLPRRETSINSAQSCTETAVYTGDICRNELEFSLACFTGTTAPSPTMAPSPIMIPAAINQERSEADADLFFSGLGFLGTSTECEEEITNFLCLKLFGLCIDGEFVSIDNETCMLLRDRLCPNEWELAGDFLGEENLPNCETLPKRQLDCDDGITTDANTTVNSTATTELNITVGPQVCAEDFYFDNDSQTCLPECGRFISRNPIARRTLVAIGFSLSLLMLLVVVPVQRRTLLRFPLVLPLYTALSGLTLTTFIIIGYFDNTKLYCSSRNFIEASSEGQETTFCTITGLIFSYIAIQLPLLVLANTAVIFWSLALPFKYRTMMRTGQTRHVHIAILLISLLLPLPFALPQLKYGFVGVEFPTPVCVGRNIDLNYYLFILPQSIMICASVILLVLIFRIIFKTLVLKKNAEMVTAAKAELKISLILIYYMVVGVVGLVSVTYSINKRQQLEEDITGFLICIIEGNIFANCRNIISGTLSVINTLTDIALVLVAFLPVALLVFSINTQNCQRKLRASPGQEESGKAT